MSEPSAAPSRLARRLGVGDAVVIGLGSMIGAGVFAAIGPAADAAGSGLLIGLAIAGVVAYCNATSSAQLAALYPSSGGTYVYGRERLGAFWGYIAGWGFVIGKVASCAAMALVVGAYAAPSMQRPVALAALVALTALNYRGIHKTALATRVLVGVVLVVLTLVVVAAGLGGTAAARNLDGFGDGGITGIMRSAGFLFFALAGYARIATLGEEVVDPATTIPKAIPRALGLTLIIYAAVAVAALAAVGAGALARSSMPLATAVRAGSFAGLAPVVRVGGAVAAASVLLGLIAGVSRTLFAMAADGHFPRWLAVVHPSFAVPHHAELSVAGLVGVLVLATDLRHAIGFSSFCVLTYYAVANAAAWTLPPHKRRWPRWLCGAGLLGCVALAFTLPLASVLAGCGVLALGATSFVLRRRFS